MKRDGIRTGGKLRVPGNINLLPQPPDSPELNPAKHLAVPTQYHLSTRVFESYNDVLDALRGTDALVAERNRIASIPTRHWASVILMPSGIRRVTGGIRESIKAFMEKGGRTSSSYTFVLCP